MLYRKICFAANACLPRFGLLRTRSLPATQRNESESAGKHPKTGTFIYLQMKNILKLEHSFIYKCKTSSNYKGLNLRSEFLIIALVGQVTQWGRFQVQFSFTF